MITITIKKDTILKRSTKQSTELASSDKFNVAKYTSFKVNKLETNNNHYKIHKDGVDWYVYKGHCTVKQEVLLDVPYLSQRDNVVRPHQTCNVTSCAMVIKYYYPTITSKGQLEDELSSKLISRYGSDAIYYHNNLVTILAEYGVKSVFNTNTSFEDVKRSLDNGHPVIYSGKFTRSGHIIVIRGYDDTGFIVNDPYGEWFSTGYQNKSGAKLHYSYGLISRVSYSGKDAGWCHICTPTATPTATTAKVNNVPQAAIDIIKEFEGCYLTAYLCPNSVKTVGIGTTIYPNGKRVQLGDVITLKQAEEYLMYEINEKIIPKLVKIANWKYMNDNQRSALISFAYNLGSNFYGNSGFTSITKVCDERSNWSNAKWIEEQFIKYRNPGSSFEQGLLRRRKAEAKLFVTL
jgi:GH24 family phage-related lysozyme (muramidase)/uncharacterized protein YvpB